MQKLNDIPEWKRQCLTQTLLLENVALLVTNEKQKSAIYTTYL